MNTRHRGGWLALAGAAVLAAWTIYQADDAPATVCTLVFDGGQRIEALPAAITDPQRRKGLSGRAAAAHGMLFSWSDSAERAFWMRDTHMALTVAFLDGDGRVFQLADMKPDTTLLHRSEKPATDAIELPQGDFQGRGIRVRVAGSFRGLVGHDSERPACAEELPPRRSAAISGRPRRAAAARSLPGNPCQI